MKRIFIIFTTMILCFQSEAKTDPRIKAYHTSQLLKKMKTMNDLLKTIAPHITPQELNKTKSFLKSKNISLKQKIPKVKLRKGTIRIGSRGSFSYKGDKHILINGHKFGVMDKEFHIIVETIFNKLSNKTSFWEHLSPFPKAQAMSFSEGFLSVLGAGAIGAFTGPAILGVSALTGGLLGVGMLYAGKELYETFQNGSVKCSKKGGNFVRIEKTRGPLFLASSKEVEIPIGGREGAGTFPPGGCNKQSLKRFKEWERHGIPRYSTGSPQPFRLPLNNGSAR